MKTAPRCDTILRLDALRYGQRLVYLSYAVDYHDATAGPGTKALYARIHGHAQRLEAAGRIRLSRIDQPVANKNEPVITDFIAIGLVREAPAVIALGRVEYAADLARPAG
jgi:hypothetical protein